MNPPKMPIHIGDFLRDTGHLRAMLVGAYMLLLFHHWSTGSLPEDDEQLSAIARLSSTEWRKARPILIKFFDEGWHHGRVEEDLAAAKASYERRAKAGEKGGKAKAETKQSSSNATAGPEQPLTLDQIPKTKEEKKETRATALVDDWPEDFREQFWARYPNRVGKPKALAKLEASRKRGVSWRAIMNGLERYIRDKPADRAWLNPETFINQERWTDQPAHVSTGAPRVNGAQGFESLFQQSESPSDEPDQRPEYDLDLTANTSG